MANFTLIIFHLYSSLLLACRINPGAYLGLPAPPDRRPQPFQEPPFTLNNLLLCLINLQFYVQKKAKVFVCFSL